MFIHHVSPSAGSQYGIYLGVIIFHGFPRAFLPLQVVGGSFNPSEKWWSEFVSWDFRWKFPTVSGKSWKFRGSSHHQLVIINHHSPSLTIINQHYPILNQCSKPPIREVDHLVFPPQVHVPRVREPPWRADIGPSSDSDCKRPGRPLQVAKGERRERCGKP